MDAPVAAAGGLGLGGILGKRKLVLLTCVGVWALSNLDQGLFGYAIPGILAEFHLRLQAIGLILTLSFVAGAAMVVLGGMAADRFGKEITLGILLGLSALMVGLQGFAGNLAWLTLLRALGFGFSAGLAPITNALVAENAYAQTRGLAMGLLQCGFPLGWLLASLFAAPLLERHGWRSICLVALAVVPLAAAVPALLGVRPGRKSLRQQVPAAPRPQRPLLAALFAPGLRGTSLATMAIFFLFGGAYAGSAFFFPLFFVQARHYTESGAAALVGISNGIAVFGYMGAALFGEFLITRRTVFVLWCLGGAAALTGLLWLSAGRTQDVLWYGVTAALFFGSQAVVIVLVSELFPAAVRTTGMAVCASAPVNLGFAIFPLIVPTVVGAAGWRLGMSLAIVPPLIGAGLCGLLLQNRRSGLAID